MRENEYRTSPQDEHTDGPAARVQWDRAVQRPWWRRNLEWLILAALVAVIAGFVASRAAPGSAPTATAGYAAPAAAPSSTVPAQMLADLDGDTTPLIQYQAELDTLEPQCTQDEAGIAALANAGYQDLTKHGINGETRLTVLRHLAASIPAGTARVDCAGILSAYLILREDEV